MSPSWPPETRLRSLQGPSGLPLQEAGTHGLRPGHPLAPIGMAADYLVVSSIECSTATVCQVQPGNQIYRAMLSASLPLPIVEVHPVLGWGPGPVLNPLTFGLITQGETEPHPTVLGGRATLW